jgi:hypothetical protein
MTEFPFDRSKVSRESTVDVRVLRAVACALERANVPRAMIRDALRAPESTLQDPSLP